MFSIKFFTIFSDACTALVTFSLDAAKSLTVWINEYARLNVRFVTADSAALSLEFFSFSKPETICKTYVCVCNNATFYRI